MKLQRLAENFYVALPLAFICVFLPILNWLALSWAVFIVLRASLYKGIVALAVVGFACFLLVNTLRFQGSLEECASLLVFLGPLWAMAYSLRVFRQLAMSLQIGFFLVMIAALLNYGIYGPLTFAEVEQFFTNRFAAQEGAAQQGLQQMYLQLMAQTMTYAWPLMLYLLQVSLLLFARFIQSRWYYPGGFQTEFHQLRLSKIMLVPLLGCFVWAMLSPATQVAIQIAGLSALLFSIAGLALVHWYVKQRQLGVFWLVLIYGVIFVLSAWILPFLTVIAIADSQLDLRKRLGGRK